jgi:hypothetical protein
VKIDADWSTIEAIPLINCYPYSEYLNFDAQKINFVKLMISSAHLHCGKNFIELEILERP